MFVKFYSIVRVHTNKPIHLSKESTRVWKRALLSHWSFHAEFSNKRLFILNGIYGIHSCPHSF